MKFLAAAAALLSLASAAPTEGHAIAKRQNSVTDELLFSVSLATFSSRRAAKDPSTLDWSSDNCSWSPDNPFGFAFEPGCQRHDFGYRNYKAQGRFTDAAKLKIDNNLKDDLYFICKSESPQVACEATANVYYEAVRAFGRKKPDEDVPAEGQRFTAYHQAVEELNEQVEKAKAAGVL